ncbi:MAG: hypothetical protein RLZZ337_343 [Bacteroidota bacterium]|jgi:alanine dehydrogenase
MKIGLIKEWKQPADKRVALTPQLCKAFTNKYPEVDLVIESSKDRTFKDEEYIELGFQVSTELSDCDILLGIKEVPIDKLIDGKTYLFFSHTIKAQAYNRKLLQAIIAKNISIIDYEVLEWPQGGRILGFGKWAGIVGAYNAFLTWGKKMQLFDLPPAYQTDNFEQSISDLKSIKAKMNNPRIVYTGNGRVASGIREVLEAMEITEVSPHDFVMKKYNTSVFTHLTNWDLYHRKDGGEWSDAHFYANHDAYCCEFDQYFECTDILINGMYWEDDMPALFTKEDTAKPNFNIKVIADITCDVEGSVPITMEATDIYNPTFGWSKTEQKKVAAYGTDTIDVMAVTNLPTEMPKNASEEFGGLLLEHIIPLLINGDKDDILKRARITQDGALTSEYSYLQEFVEGK